MFEHFIVTDYLFLTHTKTQKTQYIHDNNPDEFNVIILYLEITLFTLENIFLNKIYITI